MTPRPCRDPRPEDVFNASHDVNAMGCLQCGHRIIEHSVWAVIKLAWRTRRADA